MAVHDKKYILCFVVNWTILFYLFSFQRMSLNNEAWPGKVVEITYHEVDSQLRLVDSDGTMTDGPVLVSCDGNLKETVDRCR